MLSNFAQFQPDIEPLGAVSGFVDEFLDVVKPQSLFGAFTDAETATLTEYMECLGVPRQSTVMHEGTEGDCMAILVTGAAMILKSHDGRQKVVHEVMPGEIIGEMSLIDGRRRFASCVTTEPSDFAVLSRTGLDALLNDHPSLGNKFLLMLLRLVTSRLRHATTTLLPGLPDELV